MKKLDKFFITTLVAGFGLFTSTLAVPIEPVQALIGTNQIENNAITSPKIAPGGVTTPDVADNTITTSKIANGAVTKEKLNPNAVRVVVIQRDSEQTTVVVGGIRNVGADCAAGEVVTGGGYSSTGGAVLRIKDSFSSGNEWRVIVFNDSTADQDIIVHAECAHLEIGP